MVNLLLTVGGSDSSGGAGIQADIKTFAALGFHGASAVTAVTAQNTRGVAEVYTLPPGAVAAQMEAVVEDSAISAAKTGMLSTADVVYEVSLFFEGEGIPLVVDPVMEAEAGGRLLDSSALSLLRGRLIPLARVITPNIFEAEAITGIEVSDERSALEAGYAILDLGAEAAVVTGGHLQGDDLLVTPEAHFVVKGRREAGGNHGVGCTYSAALTAFLARGWSLEKAAAAAKSFAASSVKRSMDVGRGPSPVNPLGEALEGAERFTVLMEVERGVDILLQEPAVLRLIPEVGSNLGMAISTARGPEDVAAVEGRLVRAGSRVKACGSVRFGASGHVARILLSAMTFDPEVRAGMNIRFGDDVLGVIRVLGLSSSHFSREDEPEASKTMSWGTEEAMRIYISAVRSAAGSSRTAAPLPEVIWDRGGWGKEPMVRLLGTSAEEVAQVAVEIARNLPPRREPIN
ncbi:bifunctional hydroxymethylpyrimidine kinase/phosphomethylpyrimidine kinase [Candidatus Methanocrinis natronophilus]|uniref:Bifunctional hydroxymethylpyrimidine kinase/phosphomethylpyrimidine kinase n=1 Tax=Candidatus Methanocrinis natronophilus TaxID=3033396 RepID=A0ABT5X8D3_9EURY|nr:bifunctional hydroxymethylpyrimidine kinase/phosphomethylpyrimidine kinase [Candidatus Methanocrinis natronophilus]MDF0590943.1 bifunctional hydroxymethylpyrimidine kinase/phosphomethylpyrimidine kinase [Candidatus Methanocrinis natronophilus]